MDFLLRKIIIRFLLFPVFLALLTLLPAGTFRYWQAYLYYAVLLIPMGFALIYFMKRDPLFLERRMKAKETEKAQRIIQLVFSLLLLSGFILSGLDQRFGWSDVPVYIVTLMDIIIFSGYLIIYFVFRQNSYASRIVEVDKNQKVISNGLYGIIRHPMYFGVLLMFLPTPMALGSYWGLIPMAAVLPALVFRILNEEKVLCEELSGYKEYCQKTKYHLIPFLW